MPKQPNGTPTLLDRLVRRAQWVLVFEQLWPALVFMAALVALFVAIGWLGLWQMAPRPIRLFGVCGFVFLLLVGAFSAWRAFGPSRAMALRRLDRDAGLPHHAVSTVEDELANAGTDPTTQALWALHHRRLEAALAKVRVARPRPRLAQRDPYALRALALLLLVMAGFVAGPGKWDLVTAAFDWRGGKGVERNAFRIDAWVDPPAYTGKPPVVLFAPDQKDQVDRSVTVPAHSTVVIRSSGAGDIEIAADSGLKPDERKTDSPPARPRSPDERAQAAATSPKPDEAGEHRFLLVGKANLTVKHDGDKIASITFQTIPDQPPTIELVGGVKTTARGGLQLEYKINDDYGVVGAEASFSNPTLVGQPTGHRSLVAPPHLALTLPAGAGGLGTGKTNGDLSDHPWAGAEVTMVLSAKDEAGNIGMSAPIRITLPSRPFSHPLARALVEQRRDLVLDPDHREPIGIALDALMIAPDKFGTTNGIYLGLRTARDRLDNARDDEDLKGLADFLWAMALRIEDGNLSQAQRDLRAAEQALRDAMLKGASPEEMKRLQDQLRQAMNRYLAEMMRQNPNQKQGQLSPNAKIITQQDLERMMKQMEDAARNGDVAEAQRLLDQLQNLMDHLQTADGQAGQQSRELNRQMSELDKMTRDQQGLRDKTFRRGQSTRGQQGQPQAGQGDDADEDNPDQGDDQAQNSQPQQPSADGGQTERELGDQQQALRQRLHQLQRRMRDLGMKPEKGLGDAEQAMRDAEGALGQGPSGNRRAVESQGRALQGLQQGANGLAQQMAQGQSDGQGEGQGTGQQGQAQANGNDTDPLGRPRNDGHGSMETRGNEIGENVAQRAQRVLEELRRRLGDPNLPQVDEDYLERLLKRY